MSSSLLADRLLLTFIHVKHRLEILLNFCRISEKPSWTNDDDDGEEFYRFFGPYYTDIEELEKSIVHVSLMIENLQHEQTTPEDCKTFLDYPLCENGWTWEKIEQLDETSSLNLDILDHLSLHTNQNATSDTDNSISLVSITIPCDSNQYLLDLPPELLLHIFSFLSPFDLITNLAHTCRYFAHLILTRLYSHLDLFKLLSVFDVTHFLPYLRNLRSISFHNWYDEISILTWAIWFDMITRTTSHLHTISFQNILISPILTCLIVESFPRCLQTIIFNYQQNKFYEKFDLILSLLADQTMQLQHITASYQSGITNFGILQLIHHLNVIKELNLLYIEAINDETVKRLCEKHKPYLEILRIDGAQLTDQALNYIAQCNKLKLITIEFCTNMTGLNFDIFHNFDSLKELSLSKLPNIPLESFEILFNGKFIFEHLLLLKLGECHSIDDNCIRLLINMCPRLIDLTCSWAYSLTDESFNEIVIRCHHLRRLSLVGCYQIYGRILNDVPQEYLKHIEYLNFEHCNQIEDKLLTDLFKRKSSISIRNYYGSLVDEDE